MTDKHVEQRARPDDSAALGALRLLTAWVRVGAGEPAESEFIDSAQSEASQRAIRRAVQRGELEGFRVGKRLLVRRDAHRSWIESHRVKPKETQPAPVSLLDRLGKRRATG